MNSQSSKTLNLHFPKVDILLDPHLMEDAFSMTANGQIFRGLLRYSAKGDTVPDIAESWIVSPNKKIYTFTLKNRTFSNGKKIEAQNVQMSFARMFSVGASMGADLNYIDGVEKFKSSKNIGDLGIKVISPEKVEFNLSYPSALFLSHLAVIDCAILSIDDFKAPLNVTKDFGFSGPYKAVDISTDAITIEKWRKDELDSPNPPQVIHFPISETKPLALASSGLTDTLDHDAVPTDQYQDLAKKGWNAFPTEVIDEFFVIVNPSVVPDVARRWIYRKTDVSALTKQLKGGPFNAAFGLIPTGLPGELSEKDVSSISKSNLKEPVGQFEIEYELGNSFQESVAKQLQELWQTKIFLITLKPLKKSEKLGRIFNKTAIITIAEKGLDYPDGYSTVTYFRSGYQANYFHVEDPIIDKKITDAAKESDFTRRVQMYKDIQVDILKHFTVIPLFFGSNASGLWGPKVKSVPAHPMGFHTLPLETVEMTR